jgi:hypothetical protein
MLNDVLSMLLCKACQNIPSYFFRRDDHLHSDAIHPLDGPNAFHLPISLLKRSAQEGCALCVLLSASIDADWLGTEIQAQHLTQLRRGLIEPHPEWSLSDTDGVDIGPRQTFCLCIGVDDISHGYFFHVPTLWRKLRTILRGKCSHNR